LSWRVRIAWYEGREHFTAKASSLARHWYYARLDRNVEGRAAAGSADPGGEPNAASGHRDGSSLARVIDLGRRMAMSSWTSGRHRRYPPDAGQDQVAYEQWLVARGEPVQLPARSLQDVAARRARRVRPDEPLFSIVVPVFRPPLWSLERCVASVLAQSFEDFEFRLCDDGGGDREVIGLLRGCEAADSRFELIISDHNGGISDATNQALAGSTGRYVVFLDHDDELAENALSLIAAAIEAHPEADVLYSDSDKISPEGHRFTPALKPAWSPDLLCSGMYMGHVLVVRRRLVEEVGGLRSKYDGSQDHDLALRVTEAAGSVIHIPRILYHWRSGVGSAAANPLAKPWAREAGRSAVADALSRRGEQATVEQDRRAAGRYHCARRLVSGTAVTIALVARDSDGCAGRRRARADWDARAHELVATAGMSVVRVDLSGAGGESGLDWSSSSTAALQAAGTDLVVLLDPELLPLSRHWARDLVALVDRPGIGAVGGCVIERSRVVHAGLVAGLRGSVGPVLSGLPASRPGYQAMAIVQREVSALGAGCIVVRRDAATILERLPSSLSADLAAAALCLMLRRRGDRTLYEPAARFKRPWRPGLGSAGLFDEMTQAAGADWFRREFAAELAEGDRFYHPALSLDDPYCRLGIPGAELPLAR
jgi:glycosyltransferase involved in cell wall biosynthesis